MVKANSQYDVFISYRRETGANDARLLQQALKARGYTVFFDYDSLRDGKFDKKIFEAIDEAPVFVLMLTERALDRCVNEDDWVRIEIERAVEKGKKIISVAPSDQKWSIPEYLPDSLRAVKTEQASELNKASLFEESIDKIIKERFPAQLHRSHVPDRGEGMSVVFDSADLSPVRVFVTVPARNKSFVGREDELVRLKDICESGHIPLITGPGGVGKTELAYEFAHRHKEEYPGGCFLVPMEQALTWQDAFRFMLDVPAPECTTVGEWLTEGTKWADKAKTIIPGMVPELLSAKAKHGKVLLVLDNVENSSLIDNVGLGDAFIYGWPRNIHAIATMRHLTREFAEEDPVTVFPLGR